MKYEDLNLNSQFSLHGFKSLADAVIFTSKIQDKRRIIFTLTGREILNNNTKIKPGDFVINLDNKKGYVMHIEAKNNTHIITKDTKVIKKFPINELKKNKRSYRDWAKLLKTKPENIGRMAYEWPYLVCINNGTDLHLRDHFNQLAWI